MNKVAHLITHDNEYVDNMIPCQSDGCSYYFYNLNDKYKYCEICRRKDMC